MRVDEAPGPPRGRRMSRRRLLGTLAGVVGGGALLTWLTTPASVTGMVSLAASVEPLRDHFNANSQKVRLLALLSPT